MQALQHQQSNINRQADLTKDGLHKLNRRISSVQFGDSADPEVALTDMSDLQDAVNIVAHVVHAVAVKQLDLPPAVAQISKASSAIQHLQPVDSGPGSSPRLGSDIDSAVASALSCEPDHDSSTQPVEGLQDMPSPTSLPAVVEETSQEQVINHGHPAAELGMPNDSLQPPQNDTPLPSLLQSGEETFARQGPTGPVKDNHVEIPASPTTFNDLHINEKAETDQPTFEDQTALQLTAPTAQLPVRDGKPDSGLLQSPVNYVSSQPIMKKTEKLQSEFLDLL